jgi:hypothetical protein
MRNWIVSSANCKLSKKEGRKVRKLCLKVTNIGKISVIQSDYGKF